MTAPAAANTMFAGVPSRVWQLHMDNKAVVAEHNRVMDWIDGLLVGLAEPFEVDHGGNHYRRLRTATSGFFKLIMRAPPPSEDLPLVFSLRDLYLLGFLHGNKWYFFQDARLEGSGYKDTEHKHEWGELPLECGYSGNKFIEVALSISHLARAHEVLTHYPHREGAEVAKALYRIMVVIPEAKRFPEWLQRLLDAFSTGESTFVGSFYGLLFQNWSKISQEVLKGPAEFKPVFCFLTYSAALASVAVLLRGKPPKKMLEENSELRNPVKQYDPIYDLKDPDEPAAEEDGADTGELEEDVTDTHTDKEEHDSAEEDAADELEEDGGRGWIGKSCFFVPAMCIVFFIVWMIIC